MPTDVKGGRGKKTPLIRFLAKLSIKSKLVLISMLVSSAAMLLAGGALVTYEWFAFRQRMVADLSTQAEMVADNCTGALSFNDPSDAAEVLESLQAKAPIAFACLYRNDGTVFATYERRGFKRGVAPEPQREGYSFNEDSLVMFRQVVQGGRPIGTLYLQSDLSELSVFLRRSTIVLALMLLLTALVAYVLSSKLQEVVSKPILHLAKIAETVSQNEDYSVRATKDSEDELGVLTDTLNDMLARVQGRDAALRQSEEKYRTLFEDSRDAIYIRAREGKFLDVNQSWLDLFGYTREEMIGLDAIEMYVNPGDRSRFQREIEEKGSVRDYEVKFRKKDGTQMDCLLTATVRLASDGSVLGYQGIIRDVTAHRQADETLRKYERIVATLSDLMSLIDRDYVYQAVNDAYLKAHNQKREEIVGRTVPELFGHDVFEDRMKPHLDKSLAGAEVRYQSWLDLAGWGSKYMEVTCYPYFDEDQAVSAVVMHSRDITRTKQLETQLLQAQKMEAIGTLAGGIAHDFNNLLTPVIGQAEIAMHLLPQDSPIQHHLAQVTEAGFRARDLVQQILTFSRQSEPQRVPLRLAPVLKGTFNLLRASLPTTIEIRQNINAGSDVILADQTEIHQILLNLSTNAAHAMGEKGGVLEVSLVDMALGPDDTSQHLDLSPGPYLKLSVSDTGHGMDPVVMDRIFDPFFTTKALGEGTGMGLAVVHGIVKSYGGAIIVKSALGRGSSFDVFIPRFEGEVPRQIETPGLLPSGNERILLVDDERVVVDAVREILEHLGYRVVSTVSSISALDAFRKEPHKFDLVITDLTMPKMTGKELAREVLRVRPNVPIILCTGFSDRMTEGEAKAIGISEFVKKPVKMADLARTVRKILDAVKAKDMDTFGHIS